MPQMHSIVHATPLSPFPLPSLAVVANRLPFTVCIPCISIEHWKCILCIMKTLNETLNATSSVPSPLIKQVNVKAECKSTHQSFIHSFIQLLRRQFVKILQARQKAKAKIETGKRENLIPIPTITAEQAEQSEQPLLVVWLATKITLKSLPYLMTAPWYRLSPRGGGREERAVNAFPWPFPYI